MKFLKYFFCIFIYKFFKLKDCSFEADYDWLKPVKEKYGLKTGLVDRDGKPVDK